MCKSKPEAQARKSALITCKRGRYSEAQSPVYIDQVQAICIVTCQRQTLFDFIGAVAQASSQSSWHAHAAAAARYGPLSAVSSRANSECANTNELRYRIMHGSLDLTMFVRYGLCLELDWDVSLQTMKADGIKICQHDEICSRGKCLHAAMQKCYTAEKSVRASLVVRWKYPSPRTGRA